MLAAPIIIQAVNPREELHIVEVLGWATWVCAWLYENKADMQKKAFLAGTAKLRKELTAKLETP